tara:strand:- start:145 stop:588 length:444 start_codon:yes stop_codon:yes gene_type:complete
MDNYPEEELDLETVLREEFELEDFLNNKILKKTLTNDYQKQFDKKIKNKFYLLYNVYLENFPNMFGELDFSELYNILYNNVSKKYNTEILYDEFETTAEILLAQYQRDEKRKNRMNLQTDNIIIGTKIKSKNVNTEKKVSWANLVKN